MADYYEILGCPQDATYEELKKKYLELVRLHHPDKTHSSLQSSMFIRIDEAWKTLRDPQRKKLYDAQLEERKYSSGPLIFTTVCVSDLQQESNGEYSYSCRCGGTYVCQPERDVEFYVDCDECSFVLHVKGDNVCGL